MPLGVEGRCITQKKPYPPGCNLMSCYYGAAAVHRLTALPCEIHGLVARNRPPRLLVQVRNRSVGEPEPVRPQAHSHNHPKVLETTS